MIYNCDENEKLGLHENIFRLIQIHCYNFTHWVFVTLKPSHSLPTMTSKSVCIP